MTTDTYKATLSDGSTLTVRAMTWGDAHDRIYARCEEDGVYPVRMECAEPADTKTTQNAKHTPGPWRVDRYGIVTGGADYCTSVAECQVPPKSKFPPSEYARLAAEQHANARLIAAAPDLLEALQLASEMLHDVANAPGDPLYDPTLHKACADARAAIAKAEGADE